MSRLKQLEVRKLLKELDFIESYLGEFHHNKIFINACRSLLCDIRYWSTKSQMCDNHSSD